MKVTCDLLVSYRHENNLQSAIQRHYSSMLLLLSGILEVDYILFYEGVWSCVVGSGSFNKLCHWASKRKAATTASTQQEESRDDEPPNAQLISILKEFKNLEKAKGKISAQEAATICDRKQCNLDGTAQFDILPMERKFHSMLDSGFFHSTFHNCLSWGFRCVAQDSRGRASALLVFQCQPRHAQAVDRPWGSVDRK